MGVPLSCPSQAASSVRLQHPYTTPSDMAQESPGVSIGQVGTEQSIKTNGMRAQGWYRGGEKDNNQ